MLIIYDKKYPDIDVIFNCKIIFGSRGNISSIVSGHLSGRTCHGEDIDC